MLVKYPGLTVVGGLAMAFAICVGTVIFQVLSIVRLSRRCRCRRATASCRSATGTSRRMSAEPRALHDFIVWRSALRSVTELGAWRDVTRNLIVDGGDARPVQVAEITASGFRVADGAPLLGRVLVAGRRAPRCATGGRARVRRLADALRQ